ncbi:MAG: hypothetical protein ACLP01_32535 [Solirubrobacteraceae bacterium]
MVRLQPICSLCFRLRSVQPEIVVTDLTSRTSARGIAESRQVGTRPGLPNGAAVAALVNFKVARRYRGGKPRLYVPFFVASDLTPGLTWSDGALEAGTAGWGWVAFMAGLLTHTPATFRLLGQVNVSKGYPCNRSWWGTLRQGRLDGY